jgi:uncharacterized membrane protein (UPF0127 family)
MPEAVTVISRARVVCASCALAETVWARLRGLLGRHGLEPGEGLLLRPSGSVHTCFMRFPIDVVFLDAELEVLRVAPAVRPWRARAQRGARAVLELRAGEAERVGIGPGDRLTIERRAMRTETEIAVA